MCCVRSSGANVLFTAFALQNEKTLAKIGIDKLETMLRLRDWEQIADIKVDRRDMEALR
jgi:hypothetical protein